MVVDKNQNRNKAKLSAKRIKKMAEASVLICPPLGASPGPGSVTSKNVNIRIRNRITEETASIKLCQYFSTSCTFLRSIY